MQISGVLSDLFLKIANKLGFQLQQKQYVYNDFYRVNDISMTAVLAERLSTMITADSDIAVDGDRTHVLQDFSSSFFNTKLKASVMTALGTGDCLIVPVTNGKVFDVDIVDNDRFAVISSIGDKIYSCVMERDKFVRNNDTFRRFELHVLEEINGISVCHIYRYGYINDKEVPLHDVADWRNIPLDTIIPNVDQLLFGRFKCPTVNRDNINSPQGVPITYGMEKAVDFAKESYINFNDEYRRKKTKTFGSKAMFTKDKKTGEAYIPDGGEYQLVNSDLDQNGLPIVQFSPDLRYNDLRGGVEFNFKMLELFCGLSNGVLTDVQGVDLATATAIRASMHATFAFINTVRKYIENGMSDLLYAISMLYNANSTSGVLGRYSVKIDWDDSLMENSTEMFNMLLQAQGINAISKAEVRSWLMNEPENVAEHKISEIEQAGMGNDLNVDAQTMPQDTQTA